MIESSVFEIIDEMLPQNLHAQAWAECMGKRWYFGNTSTEGSVQQFWKMDLEECPVFQTIWENVSERCERHAGSKLKVLRNYANGHTYGLGGQPHFDDPRPGTFTLLYYPMPEWRQDWQGETLFYDGGDEIALAVFPQPNRAVFFDSRIIHVGRAPSRSCGQLRVTVAFKLEVISSGEHPS